MSGRLTLFIAHIISHHSGTNRSVCPTVGGLFLVVRILYDRYLSPPGEVHDQRTEDAAEGDADPDVGDVELVPLIILPNCLGCGRRLGYGSTTICLVRSGGSAGRSVPGVKALRQVRHRRDGGHDERQGAGGDGFEDFFHREIFFYVMVKLSYLPKARNSGVYEHSSRIMGTVYHMKGDKRGTNRSVCHQA